MDVKQKAKELLSNLDKHKDFPERMSYIAEVALLEFYFIGKDEESTKCRDALSQLNINVDEIVEERYEK